MKLFSLIGTAGILGAALTLTSTAEARPGHRAAAYKAGARAVTPVFVDFDRNRDGRIGRFEYRREISRRFARWVNRVDSDRDGFISGHERRIALKTSPVSWRRSWVRGGPVPVWLLWSKHMDQARADFSRLDRNNNGFVSGREFRRSRRGAVVRYDRQDDRRDDRRDRRYDRRDRRDDRRQDRRDDRLPVATSRRW